MLKPKIIKDAIKYLKQENIYTDKDEITLKLLETTYSAYIKAEKEVKDRGQVLLTLDFNKNKKVIINPSFRNMMDLQKELFKILDSLYLTPKSRGTKKEDYSEDISNPFIEMLKDITEKR